MDSTSDNSLPLKYFIDENHYYFLKEKLSELVDNQECTDILLTTNKDVKYVKKVHSLILDCFCDLSNLLTISENEYCSEKNLQLHHGTDVIDFMICFLYCGKGQVPVVKLTEFMDLANYLKVSLISVYDEVGSDYFIYLKKHKNKLLNYIHYIKKSLLKSDVNIISRDFKCIPCHITILTLYSKKLLYYFKNRISSKNSFVLYLPSNSKELEKILGFCYYGQVVFEESDIEELSEVVNYLEIERFLKKCKMIKKKVLLNDEANFRLVGPPKYSNPVIVERLMSNTSKSYAYFWMKNICYLVPVLCLQLLKFHSDHGKLKNIKCNDVIVCLKNINLNTLKKFIYCLYTGEFSVDTKPVTDIFDIDCGYSDQKIVLCDLEYRKVQSEINDTPLYANNLDDLRSICEKVFKDKCKSEETIIQLFSCQTCGERLLSRRALLLHLHEHKDNRHLCEHCGVFICQKFFKSHLKRHNTFNQDKRITNSEKLKHYNKRKKSSKNQKVPNNDTKFHCDICDRNFKSKYWLKRHLMKHSNRKTFRCDYCPETFSYKPHLNVHLSEIHNIPFLCPKCTTTFKTKLQLEKHMLRKHTSKEVNRCKICGKVFSRMGSLQVHLSSHTGEKPFVCKVCNKAFGRFDSMHYHYGKVHEQKKYICPVCYKNYSSRSYFLEHGWLAHKTLFDPTLHMIKNVMRSNDEKELSKLDAEAISKEVLNQSPGFSENSSSGSLGEVADLKLVFTNLESVAFICPICNTIFQDFEKLILHLDDHL